MYSFQMALRGGFRADIGTIFRAEIILLNFHPGLQVLRPARQAQQPALAHDDAAAAPQARHGAALVAEQRRRRE